MVNSLVINNGPMFFCEEPVIVVSKEDSDKFYSGYRQHNTDYLNACGVIIDKIGKHRYLVIVQDEHKYIYKNAQLSRTVLHKKVAVLSSYYKTDIKDAINKDFENITVYNRIL